MQLIDRDRAVELYGHMGPAREVSGGSAANTIAGHRRARRRAPPTSARSRTTSSARSSPTTCGPRARTTRRRWRRRDHPHETGRCMVLVSRRRRALDEHLPRRLGVPRARRHRRGRDGRRPSGSSSRATASTARTASPPSRRRSARRKRGRRQGGDHPLRPLLRRAPPRRVPADDPRRRRPAGRQRARAEVALPDRRPRGRDGRAPRPRCRSPPAPSGRRARMSWPAASGCTRRRRRCSVVDATGAGDLFAAGFLHGITTGRDWLTCARMGCLAAGEVISPRRRPARGRPARALRRGGPDLSVGAPDPADIPAGAAAGATTRASASR